jgi:hypothetical protein
MLWGLERLSGVLTPIVLESGFSLHRAGCRADCSPTFGPTRTCRRPLDFH